MAPVATPFARKLFLGNRSIYIVLVCDPPFCNLFTRCEYCVIVFAKVEALLQWSYRVCTTASKKRKTILPLFPVLPGCSGVGGAGRGGGGWRSGWWDRGLPRLTEGSSPRFGKKTKTRKYLPLDSWKTALGALTAVLEAVLEVG